MTDSIDVTYHGDIRYAVQIDPFRYPGLPDLPLGVPVEITEAYINAELSKYGVVEWGTFFFDPAHGFFNEGLPSPLITMAVREQSPVQAAIDALHQVAESPGEEPLPALDPPAEDPAV